MNTAENIEAIKWILAIMNCGVMGILIGVWTK